MNDIVRSRSDGMIAGVVGGFARHLGWPSGRVRIAFVLLSIF